MADSGGAFETVGPYRLLQKVGEGGMGEVWLAEQTEPVRRRVALKVIKAGMDTKRVVGRFEAERQALAVMDHAAIAKVFDAGATPRGLPYFVMEYVAGENINAYCDRHKLRTRERLELFTHVCEGVQHAHQKGIIHRDLKPSNVLVSISGDRPVPKIIDFGVAKATANPLTERSFYTELGVLIGTPEYMSPEQAEMTGLDVDTRTDVYSLGVMLYELLTGALPFDHSELRQAGFDEIRRRIREVEPPRPSAKVRTLGDRSTEVAGNRRTEPARLASRLKGDLDWVVMRAIEKDRTRRYGSPSELAADIQRHLRHQPVVAGPPGAGYRARKFVRRHRFGVAVAAAAAVALVGFGASMAVQAARIARERDRANREAQVSTRVSEFLTGLFQVSDPDKARGNTITAREILDKSAEKIQKELADSPEVQAQLMQTIGVVYDSLGLYPKAENLLQQSLQICTRLFGADDARTLKAQTGLAVVLEHEERIDDAGKLYRQTLDAQRRTLGDDHPQTIWSMNNVASSLEDHEQYAESEKLFRQVADWRRRHLGEENADTLAALLNLGRLASYVGHNEESADLLGKVLETQRRLFGNDAPATTLTMATLGTTLSRMGRFAEAEALYKEALEIRRRVLGTEHPRVIATINNYSNVLMRAKDYPAAESMLREAYALQLKTRGAADRRTRESAYNLARAIAKQGRAKEAVPWLRVAVENGYGDPKGFAENEDLAPLRALPEFAPLAAMARGNAETRVPAR